MTIIGTPKEKDLGEKRVAITPRSVRDLKKPGYDCLLEKGAGEASGFSDASYKDAGVKITWSASELWKTADVVTKVRAPQKTALKKFRDVKRVISFVNPAASENILTASRDVGSTLIAGYRAVIEAGNNFGRFFTGQVTAAEKVPPAKVLIVGAGVAGLAAQNLNRRAIGIDLSDKYVEMARQR